jgi:lipoate-protein ligase B
MSRARDALLRVTRLNAVPLPYAPIAALQEALARLRRAGAAPDALLLLQHAPVFSVGRRVAGSVDAASASAAAADAGAELAVSPRGGQVTYHGPGQAVLYPVVALRPLGLGARAYVEALEDAMIGAAARFSVAARGRVKCRTGVWVGDAKLGAVGVRIAGGVASHGAALNVDLDLAAFDRIVACGTRGARATSLAAELGARAPALPVAAAALAEEAAAALGYAGVEWGPEAGELAARLAAGGDAALLECLASPPR